MENESIDNTNEGIIKSGLEIQKLKGEIGWNGVFWKLADPKFIIGLVIAIITVWSAVTSRFFDIKKDLLETREMRLDFSIQALASDSARIYKSNVILSDSNNRLVELQKTLQEQVNKLRMEKDDLLKNIKSINQQLGECISKNDSLTEERYKCYTSNQMIVNNYEAKIRDLKNEFRSKEMDYNKMGIHAEDYLVISQELRECKATNEKIRKELEKNKKRF